MGMEAGMPIPAAHELLDGYINERTAALINPGKGPLDPTPNDVNMRYIALALIAIADAVARRE